MVSGVQIPFSLLTKDWRISVLLFYKLVLAWDPDYTKVTDKERAELDEAVQDFKNGETVSHEDIN